MPNPPATVRSEVLDWYTDTADLSTTARAYGVEIVVVGHLTTVQVVVSGPTMEVYKCIYTLWTEDGFNNAAQRHELALQLMGFREPVINTTNNNQS